MEEQKRERHTRRHPVRAFFRGMYTEVAFSGESLRINGRGLLFGLVVGLLVGVWGGLFARLLGAANHLREGTGWAMFLLPLAGLLVVWMYRRGGIKTAGGTDLIIQAARGEQPVSRLLAPVIFAACSPMVLEDRPAGRARPCSWEAPWPSWCARGESWGPSFRTWRSCAV